MVISPSSPDETSSLAPGTVTTPEPDQVPADCTCKAASLRYCEACALAKERKTLGFSEAGQQPTALCLSGGGVRSAALCLGVLQILANRGILSEFNYLSTVSGGGFIGAWLTRGLAPTTEGEQAHVDVKAYEAKIGGANGDRVEEVDNLRRFTNYLTPDPGLASADTWAGILLWVRNTLVNWAVFIPLMLAVAAISVAWFALTCALIDAGTNAYPLQVMFGTVGVACFGAMAFCSIIALPSHSHPDIPDPEPDPSRLGWTATQIHLRIVAPTVAWCLLVTLAIAPLAASPVRHEEMRALFPQPRSAPATNRRIAAHDRTRAPSPLTVASAEPLSQLAVLPVSVWLASLLAYAAAYVRIVWLYDYGENEDIRKQHRRTFAWNFIPWAVSNLVSCCLILLAMYEAPHLHVMVIAFAGPAWMALTEVVRSTCYVALRQRTLRAELDREWLARLNGTKMVIVCTAAIVGSAAVVLPPFFGLSSLGIAPLGIGLATGPVTAFLGKSIRTSFDPKAVLTGAKTHLPVVITLAAFVFAMVLLAIAGSFVADLARTAVDWLAPPTAGRSFVGAGLCLLMALVGTGLALFLGRVVDLENFSMHAVYRNRVTRAFLGSARPAKDKRADRYTNFDPNDDVRVAGVFAGRIQPRLFPVINVTLNATITKDTARAERKAESFTITPTSCGSAALRHGTMQGVYVDTEKFDPRGRETGPKDQKKGISLGRAVTLSGAAASPNMGYNSSPLVAFVMTMFNVRLGAWLPNPAGSLNASDVLDGSKANGVWLLLKDLIGASDLTSPEIYLSDGGHFDNLGLYEMLRRRCSKIVVIDAAQDETYSFQDLGNVLRKALIDFGIVIDFEGSINVGNKEEPLKGGFAKITYRREPAENNRIQTGQIVYIKSWLPSDVPVEVKAFHMQHPTFPHESTANQFFNENQFESYRRLGGYLAEKFMRPADERSALSGRKVTTLSELFDALAAASSSTRA